MRQLVPKEDAGDVQRVLVPPAHMAVARLRQTPLETTDIIYPRRGLFF
jgi:hypothetical protein